MISSSVQTIKTYTKAIRWTKITDCIAKLLRYTGSEPELEIVYLRSPIEMLSLSNFCSRLALHPRTRLSRRLVLSPSTKSMFVISSMNSAGDTIGVEG